jgi:membrane associated rhomboid family serine protease
MTSTPVGMRCPECARQRTQVRHSTGAPGRSDAPATYAIIALNVLAFLGELAAGGAGSFNGGGRLIADGGLTATAVADGEIYRVITSGFLHAGLLHIGFNMFALYILGTLLEPAIGTRRFVGIYAVSIIGGALGALLLDPHQLTVGASGGIFGLMAAAFLIARHRGLDELASQVGFFVVINLVITFSVPNISLGGHLGGLVGGGLAALLLTQVERRRLPNAGVIEAIALVALCALAFAGALVAANAATPPSVFG